MLDHLSPRLQRFSANDPAHVFYKEFLESCQRGDVAQVQQCLAQQTQRGREWVDSGRERNDFQKQRRTWWLACGLDEATRNDQISVMEYLHSKGAPIRYHTVEAAKSRESWEFLLNHGLDVNNPMPEANVPLMHIVRLNNPDILRWFLSLGADPNYGRNESRLYFEEGAIQPFSRPEHNSGAALELAAWKCDMEILDILLEHGAKLENSFALHRAMMRNPDEQIHLAERLLSYGADVNTIGYLAPPILQGGTPLSVAARACAVDQVRWLLEHGADPYACGPQGIKPIDYAAMGGITPRVQQVAQLLNQWKKPQV
ncbi:ankyrin [Penicillium longicatenatum]|uniref:ankyrin n=1 Tax=Penicillium longicatenatum TaxID=1561947 RepID=UPI002549869F|nr:ankyrin [Penicillium longicatenatum]KAJ5643423.1 ankyrin [Penicillium longicatenatum]